MCFSTVAPPVFTGSNYTPRFSLHLQQQTVVVFSSDRNRRPVWTTFQSSDKNLGEHFLCGIIYSLKLICIKFMNDLEDAFGRFV